MSSILVVKTAALGDVLRTTSILPGLHARYPDAEVTWVTAPGAVDLVRTHPQVAAVVSLDADDPAAVAGAVERLSAEPWAWILSFDDEEPLCRLASEVSRAAPGARLSGAHLDESGRRAYTDDVAPWFEMGLLSRLGKAEADRLKQENRRTHPEIFAAMLGLEAGRPALHLTDRARAFARAFEERHGLARRRAQGARVVGLNTGAGGRWTSKQLPVDRTVALAARLSQELAGQAVFLLLGGPAEAERNARLARGLTAAAGALAFVDAGTDNALLDFAALVAGCDLLVTSDSLALHLAIARGVPVTAFFAPTSAAEIELYGRGERVRSTAPDYCSYRPDADNSTVTVERLAAACLRALAAGGAARGDLPAWGR